MNGSGSVITLSGSSHYGLTSSYELWRQQADSLFGIEEMPLDTSGPRSLLENSGVQLASADLDWVKREQVAAQGLICMSAVGGAEEAPPLKRRKTEVIQPKEEAKMLADRIIAKANQMKQEIQRYKRACEIAPPPDESQAKNLIELYKIWKTHYEELI